MMLQLDWRVIEGLVGKALIAFGTGGLGKIVIPYLAQEPDIKIHGVTNSRVATVDAGTFLNTGLPVRSLETWARLMPDAVMLLCVVKENEDSARAACESVGFRNIESLPYDLVEALQDIYDPSRMMTGQPMLRLMCMANELRDIHKASFSEFKECYRGQTVAVVGTGPTMNHYSPLKGIPHIGVNTSFLRSDLKLDYYFTCHYYPELCEQLENYDFVKFFARNEWLERYKREKKQEPLQDLFPAYAVERNHARRFISGEPSREIFEDISYYPLMGYSSVIFKAIHFALYTRPRRILLIGCDCMRTGHFIESDYHTQIGMTDNLFAFWIDGYRTLKRFAEWNYPDMEIVSVNPAGLRGMFRDVYTESYLDAHPELNRAECEILEQTGEIRMREA